jgi:hypothetical protein
MNIPTNRDAVLAKIYKVIQSCESLNQLDVAIEMVHCYRRMYGNDKYFRELSIIALDMRTTLHLLTLLVYKI